MLSITMWLPPWLIVLIVIWGPIKEMWCNVFSCSDFFLVWDINLYIMFQNKLVLKINWDWNIIIISLKILRCISDFSQPYEVFVGMQYGFIFYSHSLYIKIGMKIHFKYTHVIISTNFSSDGRIWQSKNPFQRVIGLV